MTIRVKRAYEPASSDDGTRFLVDRIWPRGLAKRALRLDGWLKEIGPSHGLRRWFGHDPARFPEFRRRYFRELEDRGELVGELLARARKGTVTLLYSARDQRHNQAVALKMFLSRRLGSRRKKK